MIIIRMIIIRMGFHNNLSIPPTDYLIKLVTLLEKKIIFI